MKDLDKLKKYNTILDLLSQINMTMLSIDQQDQEIGRFKISKSHSLAYDNVYVLECLIYTEMKHIEAALMALEDDTNGESKD